MTALPPGSSLLVASHNKGKLAEFRALLSPRGVTVHSAEEFGLPEPVEDGDSFHANAAIKARAALAGTGLPALSDDSGLMVTALDGDPGIYSARWAGPNKDFGAAMKRVEEGLAGQSDRSATFIAVLCLALPDGQELFFEGRCEGEMIWPPRGAGGFGYDPMFLPQGESQTFGEMEAGAKHAISHRARALKLFLQALDDGPA